MMIKLPSFLKVTYLIATVMVVRIHSPAMVIIALRSMVLVVCDTYTLGLKKGKYLYYSLEYQGLY
jgi:hypothetical protein